MTMPNKKTVCPKTKRKSALNPKQALFVLEYLIDHNATQAYIRSGYSPKTAEVNACFLIRNHKVAEAIAKGEEKAAAKAEITRERWLNEHASIGFLDPIDIYNDDGSIKKMSEMPERARRAISEFTVAEIFDDAEAEQKHVIGLVKRMRLHSKAESLKQIGEACGFLKGQPIVFPENVTFRFVYAEPKKP
jgi:phage terminase small subunit